MKKTLITITLAASLIMGTVTAGTLVSAEAISASAEEYTLQQYISYTQESTGNLFGVMVYANDDLTSFSLSFNYYGMSTVLHAEENGNGFHITDGEFFQTDGQNVILQAVKNGKWISR